MNPLSARLHHFSAALLLAVFGCVSRARAAAAPDLKQIAKDFTAGTRVPILQLSRTGQSRLSYVPVGEALAPASLDKLAKTSFADYMTRVAMAAGQLGLHGEGMQTAIHNQYRTYCEKIGASCPRLSKADFDGLEGLSAAEEQHGQAAAARMKKLLAGTAAALQADSARSPGAAGTSAATARGVQQRLAGAPSAQLPRDLRHGAPAPPSPLLPIKPLPLTTRSSGALINDGLGMAGYLQNQIFVSPQILAQAHQLIARLKEQERLYTRDAPGNGWGNYAMQHVLALTAGNLQLMVLGHEPKQELAVAGHLAVAAWHGLTKATTDPAAQLAPQIAQARAALMRNPTEANRKVYAALMRQAFQKEIEWQAEAASPGGPLAAAAVKSVIGGVAKDFTNLWGASVKCVQTQYGWDCADALVKVPMPVVDVATAWNVGGVIKSGGRVAVEQGGRVIAGELTEEAAAAEARAAGQTALKLAARKTGPPAFTGTASSLPGSVPGRMLLEHVDYPTQLVRDRLILVNGKLARVILHEPQPQDIIFDYVTDVKSLPARQQAEASRLLAQAEQSGAWRKPGVWKVGDLVDDGHARVAQRLQTLADEKLSIPRKAVHWDVVSGRIDARLLDQSVEALNDNKKFAAWAKDLKADVLTQMKADNVAFDEKTFDDYLMRTARKRLQKAGFVMPPDGAMDFADAALQVKGGFVMVDRFLKEDEFMSIIKRGLIPIDSVLPSQPGVFSVHGPVSHLLQNVYLSDTVDGYARLYPELSATTVTEEGQKTRHLWDLMLESSRGRNLGNPAVVQVSVCQYLYITPCPARIDWLE